LVDEELGRNRLHGSGGEGGGPGATDAGGPGEAGSSGGGPGPCPLADAPEVRLTNCGAFDPRQCGPGQVPLDPSLAPACCGCRDVGGGGAAGAGPVAGAAGAGGGPIVVNGIVPTNEAEAHGAVGCCGPDGAVYYYAPNGVGSEQVFRAPCAVGTCGWDAGLSPLGGGYDCGTDGQADPSGAAPPACGPAAPPPDPLPVAPLESVMRRGLVRCEDVTFHRHSVRPDSSSPLGELVTDEDLVLPFEIQFFANAVPAPAGEFEGAMSLLPGFAPFDDGFFYESAGMGGFALPDRYRAECGGLCGLGVFDTFGIHDLACPSFAAEIRVASGQVDFVVSCDNGFGTTLNIEAQATGLLCRVGKP
jgi:hypothetical protein